MNKPHSFLTSKQYANFYSFFTSKISLQIVLLTFCIQQIFGQENVKSNEFAKSPRRLSDDSQINFRNDVKQKVPLEPTDIFDIRKPTRKDKSYDDFLSFLYRNDKEKPRIKREIGASFTNDNDIARGKRALVFR